AGDLGRCAAVHVCAFSALFLVNQKASPVQASRRASSVLDLVGPAGAGRRRPGKKTGAAHGGSVSTSFTFRAVKGAPCTAAQVWMLLVTPGSDWLEQQQCPEAIPTLRKAHRISRSKLYALWRSGIGPRAIKIGSKNLITAEAACEWRRQLEAGGRSSSP